MCNLIIFIDKADDFLFLFVNSILVDFLEDLKLVFGSHDLLLEALNLVFNSSHKNMLGFLDSILVILVLELVDILQLEIFQSEVELFVNGDIHPWGLVHLNGGLSLGFDQSFVVAILRIYASLHLSICLNFLYFLAGFWEAHVGCGVLLGVHFYFAELCLGVFDKIHDVLGVAIETTSH